jgi:effector-binding domain-containing protein
MGKGADMTDLTVEMRDLDEMVVVSGTGFGVEPEPLAWDLIFEFAARQGFDVESGDHRFFGFNNPNPSPGIPEYGYEQWMTIPANLEVDLDGPVTRKTIPAGTFAVTRFKGLQQITETWREFLQWFEESGLSRGDNWEQCYEEMLNPGEASPDEWEFELYLPVAVDQ